MAITINGEGKRIGLALSGGGFRAACYHLGVMKKLDDLGLLDKIDLLSCVSGGSIAGGVLALHWGTGTALDELEKYLSTRSIAVSSVIGGLLDPFEGRLDKLARSYDKHLFDGKTLSTLAGGPRIYFNATNLATGNLFSSSPAAVSRRRWASTSSGCPMPPTSRSTRRLLRHRPFHPCSRLSASSSTATLPRPRLSTSRSPTAGSTIIWA